MLDELIHHYSDALLWIGLITAIAYFVVTVMLYLNRNGNVGMFLWFLQCTLYWSGITVARYFFGYVGPSFIVTMLGAILYLEAPVIAFGDSLLRRRYNVE